MLTTCWSAKGGSGTTVIASCLALLQATREPAGAVLADLAGDVTAALGLPEPESPGLAGWLAAGESVPADALGRLEIAASQGLAVLPRGKGMLKPDRAEVLAALLDNSKRNVVADCGTRPRGAAAAVVGAASQSLLVIRPCYLALRRAARASYRPSAVIVLREPGRSLGRVDIEQVVDAPVVAEVELDPAVARAVDAGLLAAPRLPRAMERALRGVT